MPKCIICRTEYTGFGNNAYPIVEGRCCDECNTTFVVPTRIRNFRLMEKLTPNNKETPNGVES